MNDKPGVIQKPKITVNQLQQGDTLILACDGLKDFVNEDEIIKKLEEKPDHPAKSLVDYAINEKDSTDNVTVLTIKIS